MASDLRERIVAAAIAEPSATTADLAREFGCSHWTVAAALKDARRLGIHVPRRPRQTLAPRSVEIQLVADVRETLRDAAALREMSLSRLVTRLIAAAARDGLIDAILDDGAADA